MFAIEQIEPAPSGRSAAPLPAAHLVDPNESAVCYVRVLEIPTPRCSTFDAVRFGIALSDNVPATVQDRAYTSLI